MEDAPLVGVLDRPGDLGHQPRRGARVGGVRGQAARQAPAPDQLHAEVVAVLVFPDAVDRHDPRVIEVRDRLGLDAEPPEVGLPGEQAGADHLDGDRTVQAHLPRLEHDPHRPLTQAPDQLEVAEPRRGRGSREVGRADAVPGPR